MKRIHMISGPRNISTAMMYSFANRSDTKVVDEPFYGYYLLSHGSNHPGRNEIINSMTCSLPKILEQTVFSYYPTPIVFLKNMAHHLVDVSPTNLLELSNFFLIRDLKKLIYSFSKVIPKPTLIDIGIKEEYDLFKYLESHHIEAPVIDTDSFLNDPKESLNKLCDRLLIPFQSSMLHWPKGSRKEDGIWSKYWYQNVHQSSGFSKHISRDKIQLEGHLKELYEIALPYYSYLKERTL